MVVMCYKPEYIQQSFEKYYKKLYSQSYAAEISIVENFQNSLDLPSVGKEENNLLTQEITENEIDEAISRLKHKKD